MNKKVTIQDIADALCISRNTVSKAINNADGLADSTREKILQKAVEMGYKQFSYAGSIAIPRNSTLTTVRPGQWVPGRDCPAYRGIPYPLSFRLADAG